jgi:hypothetical protein
MFRLCTSRTPASAEVDRIVASYERQLAHYRSKRMDAARVLRESRDEGRGSKDEGRGTKDEGRGTKDDQPERAAWTLVANALLNLDETVTH